MITQVVTESPIFYGTWRFITMFTGAHNWTQSWATCTQSTSWHFTFFRSTYSHLCL